MDVELVEELVNLPSTLDRFVHVKLMHVSPAFVLEILEGPYVSHIHIAVIGNNLSVLYYCSLFNVVSDNPSSCEPYAVEGRNLEIWTFCILADLGSLHHPNVQV